MAKTYGDVRNLVQPGDVVAFGGNHPFSNLLKRIGRTTVSHAGLIVSRGTAAAEPKFVDATVDDKSGQFTVGISSFRRRQETYEGDVWWLPLSPAVRATFDEQAFDDYLQTAVGRPFDVLGAFNTMANEALGILMLPKLTLFDVRQDYAFFCSQLVVETLQRAGIAMNGVNAADVSPGDLVAWKMYADQFTYLPNAHVKPTGMDVDIPRYNTLPPGTTEPLDDPKGFSI